MKANTLLLTLVLALGLGACGQEQQAESPASGSTAPAIPPAAAPAAPADATPASVDGKAMYAAKCALCHGNTGEGRGTNPKLVGLSVAEIESRLNDYRAGKQMGSNSAIMAAAAKSLSDEQIAAIAGFLGE
ncbi:MAG: c-type cytochrome [Thiobacillaceae bacterium]|jgi:cytochrome c553|nr:c-type cytochrome [Thiobacillaceae bacterium]